MREVISPGNVLRRRVAAATLVVGGLTASACSMVIPEETFNIDAFCPDGADLQVGEEYINPVSSSRGHNQRHDNQGVEVGCVGPEDWHNVPPLLFGPDEGINWDNVDQRFSWQGSVQFEVTVEALGRGAAAGPQLGMDMNTDGSGVASIEVQGPESIARVTPEEV